MKFLASLSYKYMKIWTFHGQYKASGLGINKISYNIFDLRHVSKVAAHFRKENKMFIYSFKYPNEESGKLLKNEAAEPYLEPCQISIMDHFCIMFDILLNTPLRLCKILNSIGNE